MLPQGWSLQELLTVLAPDTTVAVSEARDDQDVSLLQRPWCFCVSL